MRHNDYGTQRDFVARVYSSKSGYEYRHIYIDFFFRDDQSHRQYSFHALQHFQISCQIDQESISKIGRECYAWRFETNNIEMDNYKEICKVFSEVNKKYTTICEMYGTPDTFQVYATYLLNAIGIKFFTDCNEEYDRKLSDLKGFLSNILEAAKRTW
jgi:hypothetical protein